jgi:hypothetical protein
MWCMWPSFSVIAHTGLHPPSLCIRVFIVRHAVHEAFILRRCAYGSSSSVIAHTGLHPPSLCTQVFILRHAVHEAFILRRCAYGSSSSVIARPQGPCVQPGRSNLHYPSPRQSRRLTIPVIARPAGPLRAGGPKQSSLPVF